MKEYVAPHEQLDDLPMGSPGTPGRLAPMSLFSGMRITTSYHMAGILFTSRWGSLHNMGASDNDLPGPTTQLLLAIIRGRVLNQRMASGTMGGSSVTFPSSL